jgi:hypothetical protein
VIFFVAPADETWEMEEYLQQYGGTLCSRLRILTYDDIVIQREVPLGSYIFAAIDQLSPTERAIAVQCWHELSSASSDLTLINNPTEVLCRYDLLQACFALKRNTFRVRRASEFYRPQRFPVFIRAEREHTGGLTRLLYTRRQAAQALTKLLLLGYRLRDLLIVEYCETVDAAGVFRDYCAAIVGDRIIPQALVHMHNWVTKWDGRLVDADKAREQREYVDNNPHAQWLRETFELAKIRYGRIDYGVKDGVPQVWEVNTNPTIVRRAADPNPMPEEQRNLLAPVRDRFIGQCRAALAAIDSEVDPTRTLRIDVSPRQLRQLAAEKRLRRRLQARKTALGRAAYVPLRLLRHFRGT